MISPELTATTAVGIKEHLALLERERASAALNGDADDGLYIDDLRAELEATRQAYIGTAVTEIAALRAVLGGPLLG
jgi:hypothetical protein